jgi:branched-chain amino acid transport system permease protein
MTPDIFMATLIGGVINGGLYALLGIAIVLIFSTTGVANFAQGELASFSSFVLLMIVMPAGIGIQASWGVTLLAMGAAGALIYFLLIRPRASADHLSLAVRTLGLSMLLHAVDVFSWGKNEPYRFPSLFGTVTLQLGPVALSRDQLGTLAAACVVGGLFFFIFRRTMIGLAMRAMAVDRDVAALQGVNVQKTTVAVWVLATAISAVVGLLAAPISFLETSMMQPYILKAFTAAILGGMHSFPGVVAGGVLLGVAEAFAAAGTSVEFREPFTFVVLLMVLLLRPQGLFASTKVARRV